MSGNDLRDFYYMFCVSEERSRRNILCGPVLPSEVRHLSCFKDEFEKASMLYGSLATMAMGDCQAVALAQTCHVSMALQHGVFYRQSSSLSKGSCHVDQIFLESSLTISSL